MGDETIDTTWSAIGSNLARLELVVALQEWLRAFPHYRLDESRTTTWANGQVRGSRHIPVLLHGG